MEFKRQRPKRPNPIAGSLSHRDPVRIPVKPQITPVSIQASSATRPVARPVKTQPKSASKNAIGFEFLQPVYMQGEAVAKKIVKFSKNRSMPSRFVAGLFAALFVSALIVELMQPKVTFDKYSLDRYEGTILSDPIDLYGQKLVVDQKTGAISYNDGYSPASDVAGESNVPKITASFGTAPEGAVTVNDPVNSVGMTLKPKFKVDAPQKNQNRVVYPIIGKNAVNVYTLKASGVKEDIILNSYQGNEMRFDYDIELNDGLEARIEADGSLAVYGVASTLLGSVSAGSENDEQLLSQARKNGEKNQLIFRVPAPFIVQADKQGSKARASFSLQNNVLSLYASNLKEATYPLSIDPSVYVETASKLMKGNNETNIDFDTDNELIQKGRTTGARFNQWNDTMQLNEGRWNQGTAVAGGYVYSVGGSKSNKVTQVFSAAGSDTYTVPAGITSISIKAWGAGGGGGGGTQNWSGGAGGGGGYASSTITVTPGESLNVRVGGGGAGGFRTAGTTYTGDGGAGGGYSGVLRSSTPLLIAAGGGAGGGSNDDNTFFGSSGADGSAGRPGGGTSGQGGDGNGTTTGGGAGTQSAGGSGGTVGGTAGSSLNGGNGGSLTGVSVTSSTGGGSGGRASNGSTTNNRPGGGGGGGGYFGGGGGGRANARYNGGGGGGGGSSYTTGSLQTTTAGSGTSAGNSSDADYAGFGQGGAAGTFSGGGAGTDGYVIITYTLGGAANSTESTVTWAKLSTTNNSIESPNPGTGACANWCSNNAYDLPAARKGLSLVAYNGYLFALGGVDAAGNRSNSVYIAKIGANGEPSLWHPTDTNKANWTYWHTSSTTLSSARSYTAATAYNNRLYLVGGQTAASPGGVTTVEKADISPVGTLSSWSTSGIAALPSAVHSHTVEVYNDRLYVLGGANGTTLQSSVYYNKINNDGTINSWTSTSGFSGARSTWGGSYTTIWGGYIYLMGGCTAVNGSGYCTSIASDVQLASINADGSLAEWGSILGLTNQRIGFGLVSWRNAIYSIGGCTSQSATTGDCTTVLNTSTYGVINSDGDASTVNNSVASGTAPCSGGSPTSCNIPPAGDNAGQGGRMASGVVVNNGYIYIIGGCAVASGASACSGGMSGNVSYASISSDGSIVSPATCSGTAYGSWCVDSTNRINGTAGVGTMATVVFNNTIYAIGGTSGSGFLANIYRVSVNTDGSLTGAWQVQTFATVGMGAARGYSLGLVRSNPTSANTNPGNLYVLGGCSGTSGIGCSTYYSDVYKCNIATAGTINGCTTTGQLQIDAEPSVGGVQGLGLMAGFMYANYIYLMGGSSANNAERGEVMYAKLDSDNNIVAATGSTWVTSPNVINPIRRRGFAFGYNGYLYSLAGYNPSDSLLNDLLFAKINVSDGSIGTFQTSEVTVSPRWDLRAIVSNGYVYAIGGCSVGAAPSNCTSTEGSVQTFQLYNNESGSPSAYNASAGAHSVGPNRQGASSVVLNNYIYVAGGCVNFSGCADGSQNVQYALLDANGNIGTWASTTGQFGTKSIYGQLESAGGTLYYIGGSDLATSSGRTTVYYATPSGVGNVSSWATATNGLPAGRAEHGATVWNNRIYVTGGRSTGTETTVQNTIFISPQLNSGGNITSAWTTSGTTMQVARSGHTAIAYANNLYTLGGFNGTSYLNDTQYSKINADGSIGTWIDTTSLPQNVRNAEGFAVNGFMYLIGGRSATSVCTSNTYVAPVSANTTIASGNNPTGLGEWYQTNVKFTGDRHSAAVTYHDGKIYVLGGGCGTPLATNQHFISAVKSQPQVAKYSRLIDTDTDVFPNKWLINGLDNSIGARWNLKYRSSTSAAASYGTETDYGAVTLGTPDNYYPLNGSGVNSNFARYYYMYVTIDSSRAFGYPEDVARGPTMTDISLFFTSDPSKRLRHGKTFTGGEQQPLDTPF